MQTNKNAKLISRLDVETDNMLNLCEFCLPCTRNSSHAANLRTAAALLNIVDAELIPALIQVGPGANESGK